MSSEASNSEENPDSIHPACKATINKKNKHLIHPACKVPNDKENHHKARYIFNLYEHRISFIEFVLVCLMYTIFGIVGGSLIEISSIGIENKYNFVTSTIFQTVANILFLSIMRFYVFPLFIIQLQTLTIGLLFCATFFGVQGNWYKNSLKLITDLVNLA